MARRKTTEEFIQDAKEVHGDKYDYSRTNYTYAKDKVTIICPEHGEFEQSASNHLSGSGCKKCGIESTANKKTLGTNEFINKAKEVHGDKYDYSKTNYTYAQDKVTIICPKHGEFKQEASSHLTGYGCRYCSYESNTKTTEEFIQEAKEVHGDKYDYSKVNYKKTGIKVTIICPEHGEFEQIPSAHLGGQGCKKCGYESNTKTTEEIIQRAKEVHGNKYDYSKVNYRNADTKITIICPEHGEFEQEAHHHLRGQDCRKCADESRTKTTEEFIQEAKEVHGNKYDYSKVCYEGIYDKVTIICSEHGEFEQKPSHHLRGNGCKECALLQKGWFNEKCKLSNSFESFKLYIVKINTNEERFYKIGRTYRPIDHRVSEIPYQCNIIHIKKSNDPKEIVNLETKFKNICKEYIYEPNIEFGGMKDECFTSIDPILKFLD